MTLECLDVLRTDGRNDPIHQRLRRSVEKRQKSYLWTPADAITFTPRLLPIFYGDGRALFTIATINQRPAYWIIRACSTWGSGLDWEDGPGPDFGEMTDQILTDLEEAFSRARCGYSGSSLLHARKYRLQWCQCEDCSEPGRARWPSVDDEGGCSWSRMDWPKSFATELNPLSSLGSLLISTTQGAGDGTRDTQGGGR